MVAYENREPFQFGNIVQDSRRSRRRQSAIDGALREGSSKESSGVRFSRLPRGRPWLPA